MSASNSTECLHAMSRLIVAMVSQTQPLSSLRSWDNNIKVPNCFELFRLVVLDISAHHNNKSLLAVIGQIRRLISRVNIYKTIDECERFITSRYEDTGTDHIIIVIASSHTPSLTHEMIQRVHACPQVVVIYILSSEVMSTFLQNDNDESHRSTKINYVEVDKLSARIVADFNLTDLIGETADVNLQMINENQGGGESSTNPSAEQYAGLELFNLSCKTATYGKKDLLSACRDYYAGDTYYLKVLDEFERDYQPTRALWWYTKETLIYNLLNKALRTFDRRLITLFGFFINDMHQALTKLHASSSLKESILLYRGQIMKHGEVTFLSKRVGEHVTIRSFLSTSTDRVVALMFAQQLGKQSDVHLFETVLLEIEADPTIPVLAPFANIQSQSNHPDEEEWLFYLNPIFILTAVERDDDCTNPTIIKLSLAHVPEHLLTPLKHIGKTADISKIYTAANNLVALTNHLHLADRQVQERKRFLALREGEASAEKSMLLAKLGNEACNNGNFTLAIECHTAAIHSVDSSFSNQVVRSSWEEIGYAHAQLEQFDEAIHAYRQTLNICALDQMNVEPENLTCWCRRWLAILLACKNQYDQAIELIEKNVEISESIVFQKEFHVDEIYYHLYSLDRCIFHYSTEPDDQEWLLDIYDILGDTYMILEHYSRARFSLQRALNISRTNNKTESVQSIETKLSRFVFIPDTGWNLH